MPDIRLTRARTSNLWFWIGLLIAAALLVWGIASFVGDPTNPEEPRRVGAKANFGAERAPVIPMQPAPFTALDPLATRDLGRLLRLEGVAESRVVANTLWVRAPDGRRILVRFEPEPPEGSSPGIYPGARVALNGYLQKISQAEFGVWTDTLGVSVPQPPPGRKFGDLPDSSFLRVDSLFIKTFYVSVRPDELGNASGERSS